MQCILCKSDEINDLEMGEMKTDKNIHVHYFCMLLSSSLLTNGEENDGILGFLPFDIVKESRRAARLKCHYCHQMGAAIGCCIPTCNRSFHLNCGLKNNCLNQFTEEFLSFCDRHVEESKQIHSPDHVCIICYSKMGKYEKTKSIFAPCCKSEWFHKMCLMRFANSAGYFFKCPKCNDVEKFTEECMKSGIFIPQRDAAWETEANAYEELMERPNECVAKKCLCPDGRDSDKPSNELLICETCGSNCMHKNCWQRNEAYYCCFPTNLASNANETSEDENNPIESPIRNSELNKDTDQNQNRRVESSQMESTQKKKRKRKISDHVHDSTTTIVNQLKAVRVRLSNRNMGESTKKSELEDDKNCAKKRRVSRRIYSDEVDVGFQSSSKTKIRALKSEFPITRIRNGSFDEFLRCKPMILLTPLSPEKLKMLSRRDHCVNKINTSSMDNNSTRDKLNGSVTSGELSFEFAIISPTKKKLGKSFKNYTITSFFKPVN